VFVQSALTKILFAMETKQVDLAVETAEFRRRSEESIALAVAHGVVVDMTEWLTIKRYAEAFGLSTQVVTNWISRGIIPPDSVMDLPELNNMRLVKNRAYR
jgi:hypothetical protein